MAKENENIEKQLEEPIGLEEKTKKSFNPKVFIIGIPLFVLQLVIVYFVTANILLTKFESSPLKSEGDTVEAGGVQDSTEEESENETEPVEIGKHIFSIEDIIVNPTGTNGQRLLLVSMAFDLKDEVQLESIKQKEVVVKDMVISTLSSKTMNELSAIGQKDSLKAEISKGLSSLLPELKINSVYFSKYVIN
ncbi:MAG: flagellar basal body-associated FliL family protein [Melioribacteraceae bacterium]|nr:MAG: flagellar basal body-associated FliL family protein [Melioribacteraceae bacterium]